MEFVLDDFGELFRVAFVKVKGFTGLGVLRDNIKGVVDFGFGGNEFP